MINELLFHLTYQRMDIKKGFKRIEVAMNHLFKNRRFIQMKYIFYKLFRSRDDKDNMRLCIKRISKKTRESYRSIWRQVCELSGWVFIDKDGFQ